MGLNAIPPASCPGLQPGQSPRAFTQDRGLGVIHPCCCLEIPQHLVNKGPHVFILRYAPNYVAGPASLVPHTSRMKTAPVNSPGPALHPSGLLVCSLQGLRVARPRLNTPTRALASDFAELTLAGEASPCSSGIYFCLLPPRASLLLPLVQPRRSCLCTHPHTHHGHSHSACWSPPPVSPSGCTRCLATPSHVSDVTRVELLNEWPLSCPAVGSLGQGGSSLDLLSQHLLDLLSTPA